MWRNAELVPRKGSLSGCDYWTGIALLNMVGKVVHKIVQDRLQMLAAHDNHSVVFDVAGHVQIRYSRCCWSLVWALHFSSSWRPQAPLMLLEIIIDAFVVPKDSVRFAIVARRARMCVCVCACDADSTA